MLNHILFISYYITNMIIWNIKINQTSIIQTNTVYYKITLPDVYAPPFLGLQEVQMR